MANQDPESVGDLIPLIQEAIRSDDRRALDVLFTRLARAVHVYRPLCRALGFRGEGATEEALQLILVALYGRIRRHAAVQLEHPAGWARQAAEWALIDEIRGRERLHTGWDEGDLERRADESGVYQRADLHPDPPSERRYEAWRSRLADFVDDYAHAAARAAPRGREQVRAWALLRLEGRSAIEVAEALGAAHLANRGRDAVWQWAARGAGLVRRLAASDNDRWRAEAMARAVGHAGRQPRAAGT